MSSAARNLPITAAEYLEGELRSEIRHEFVDGRIYAMSGVSFRHHEICGDTYTTIRDHLRGGPCRVFMGAVKVQTADDLGESYYYPDVFATSEAIDDRAYLARSPKLIIEVLSESTSRFDRGDKLATYKRMPSVEEIVYIEQDWPEIYIVRRSDRWKKHIYTQFDSLIHLESIDLTLPVSAFYRSAPFPDDVKRPWYLINREDG